MMDNSCVEELLLLQVHNFKSKGKDSRSPDQEAIVWKFEDNGGNQYNLTPSPQDGFALNGISFVSGISYDALSCAIDVEGCTDSDFVEYNSNATIDDGSCLTLIVVLG